MKSKILTVILAVMALTTVNAQQRMVLRIDGKDSVNVEVWRIDQVSFVPEEVAVANAAGQQVTLGDLKWADRNLEATQGEKLLRLAGWGDTSMTNLSKKLEYFPIANPTAGIASSNYDVASHKWGSGWRLPTKDELEALLAASTRKWINRHDSVGCMLTVGTDSIFLPALGYREGETVTGAGVEAWIWSGTLGTTSTDNAFALKLSEGADPQLTEVPRYRGCAIRPVAGRIRVPVTVTETTVTPDKTTAKVVATLGGDKDDVTLIGISYAKTKASLTHGDSNDDSHQVTTTIADQVTFNFTGLDMNTTYYALVYVKTNDGSYTNGDTLTFKTLARFPEPDYVDLGLPSGVRWAKWNMGSSSELDIPNTTYSRFGWGDPTGEVDSASPSAYAAYSWGGYQNKKDISGSEYDIASVQWGKKWRIPTPDDFTEISETSGYTTWEYGNWADSQGNGYPAWKVTSVKYPDRYIFFPAAGLITTSGVQKQVRDYAYYWTSCDNGYGVARYAELIRDASFIPGDYGLQIPIRPVYGKPGEFSSGVDPVTPIDPDPIDPEPTEPEKPVAGTAVDFGLPSGTLWADRNVGALSAEDYGEYIQWGDSIERDNCDITHYIYRDVNDTNGFTYLGTSENHWDVYSIGGTEYDAARYRWGGSWKMPNRTQVNELRDECTWTWSARNGVWGYEVSRNGKSIFLPAGGYKTGGSVVSAGTLGFYWTENLDNSIENYFNRNIRILSISESKHQISYKPRYQGVNIRPVQ